MRDRLRQAWRSWFERTSAPAAIALLAIVIGVAYLLPLPQLCLAVRAAVSDPAGPAQLIYPPSMRERRLIFFAPLPQLLFHAAAILVCARIAWRPLRSGLPFLMLLIIAACSAALEGWRRSTWLGEPLVDLTLIRSSAPLVLSAFGFLWYLCYGCWLPPSIDFAGRTYFSAPRLTQTAPPTAAFAIGTLILAMHYQVIETIELLLAGNPANIGWKLNATTLAAAMALLLLGLLGVTFRAVLLPCWCLAGAVIAGWQWVVALSRYSPGVAWHWYGRFGVLFAVLMIGVLALQRRRRAERRLICPNCGFFAGYGRTPVCSECGTALA